MKKEKQRKSETYFKGLATKLVNSCLESKGTISDKKVKEIIIEENKGMGASCDLSLIKSTLDKLLKVLGDKLCVVKGDKIGKRTPLLIEIKDLSEETRQECIDNFLKIIEDGWYCKKKEKRTVAERKEMPQTSEKKSTRSNNIRLDTLTKIMDVLQQVVRYNKESIDCDSAAKILGINKVYKSTVESWKNCLTKHGIELSAYYSGRMNSIMFNNAELDLAKCCRLYTEITKKEPGEKYFIPSEKKIICKTFRAKNNNSVIIKEEKTVIKDDEVLDMYFYIAGLIVENNYTAINTDVVCMYLNKDLGFNRITKSEVKNILKQRKEFNLIKYGEAVSLEQGWKSWETIKDDCSPKMRESWVDCRFKMSTEEIKRFFPKVEVLSAITENDGFYRVYYSRSKKSIMNWAKLVMATIGKENMGSYIFDTKLVERIKEKLERIEIVLFENDLGLKIENL